MSTAQAELPIATRAGSNSTTFQDNLKLPVHRWYRYSAGFSAAWVKGLLCREKINGRFNVLDPFAGAGTVLIEGEASGVNAIGVDSHPFVARVAQAKLYWRESAHDFQEYAHSILCTANNLGTQVELHSQPTLLTKCFPDDTLRHLISLREAWKSKADSTPLSELTWLALISILRSTSPVGTAQWQYVLPQKTKKAPLSVYEAFRAKVEAMANDMLVRQGCVDGPPAKFYRDDARLCSSVSSEWADLIVTSPPYANNYDYADATRLEMTFMQDILGWGDLQGSVRKYLIRACTQHVGKLIEQTRAIAEGAELEPIRKELLNRIEQLDRERNKYGGKKQYHTMIAAYFSDLAKVWVALRRVSKKGALVCFVIGDSAPYGVHIPVDTWLGELAVAAGFEQYSFEKIRDRNVKWKNRKHRVPLQEGLLWVQG